MSDSNESVQRNVLFNDPEHSLMAVLENGAGRDKVISDLKQLGFNEDEITVADSESETRVIDDSKNAPLGFMRNLVAQDEIEVEQNYKKAVEKGHTVILVHTGDEDESRRHNAEKVLFGQDAKYMHYFRERTYEAVLHHDAKDDEPEIEEI